MATKKKKVNKKVQSKSFDFILFIAVLCLLGMGITMVLSASSPSSLATTGSSYTFVEKQAISAVIGLVAMIIISKIDYKQYAKFYKIAFWVSFLILFLVLVPGLGRSVNGARRWINIPVFGSFQPSELTKIGLIVFFAVYLSKHKDELKHIVKGFIKPLAILAVPIAVLFLVQTHLSASVIIIAVVAIMMLMAGSRMAHFATFGSIFGRNRYCGNVYIS